MKKVKLLLLTMLLAFSMSGFAQVGEEGGGDIIPPMNPACTQYTVAGHWGMRPIGLISIPWYFEGKSNISTIGTCVGFPLKYIESEIKIEPPKQ